MAETVILVSGAVVYKRSSSGPLWFIVKGSDQSSWEIPKTIVRRGESSVRAAIRNMAEQGGMRAKVLEEVGRSGGAVKSKGKVVTQRYIFYLMVYKDGGEVLGYSDFGWLEYAQASKKLETRRDKGMLREANKMLKQIDRERKKKIKEAGLN
jgi:ADP-ribose pyrophosphatase YjhB (NUDIX family)